MMELQGSDFDGTKLSKSGTIPVLFTASWCPYCRMFAPIFESRLREERIEGALVDLSDLGNRLWDSFRVEIVPTVIVFKDGEAVLRKDGIPGVGLEPTIMVDIVQVVIGEATTKR